MLRFANVKRKKTCLKVLKKEKENQFGEGNPYSGSSILWGLIDGRRNSLYVYRHRHLIAELAEEDN